VKLKVSQRSEAFFELFQTSADNVKAAAKALRDLTDDYTDVELKARRIQEHEYDGDQVTHEIIQRLNTTFITPMDREDIHKIATDLDDVMDAIEAAADLFVLHAVQEPLPVMRAQADVLYRAAQQTAEAFREFPRMGKAKLQPYWIEINSLENEGDRLYRRALADLFGGDHRAMDVLRWREVIEKLEEALDELENVANTIESVVLKHA
jgi:predicted phosphate transport protein (TIGR00153 family)